MLSVFKSAETLFWGVLFGAGLLISTVLGLIARNFG
jgi:hypothetical protein